MKKTLWILEDEPDILEVTAFVGTKLGYDICFASSVHRAWEMLDKAIQDRGTYAPRYLVTDYHLDDGDSFTWLMALLCVFPKTKILCMSGTCSQEMIRHFQLLRIYFLQKPTKLSDLIKFLTP